VSDELKFYHFEVKGVDPGTGEEFTGALTQTAIAPYQAALKMAQSIEDALARAEPERQIKVRPVGKEDVGPIVHNYIMSLMAGEKQTRTTARILAHLLAKHEAKGALELNPDLARIADVWLAKATATAMQLMMNEVSTAATIENEGAK
jgi:hypothetical protein